MKKLYIYVFSIFLLFLTNVNSVEDFEKGEAYQLVRSEVPANEQWMVNRLSQQYPNLEETEYDWVYFVDISTKGTPNVKKLQIRM